MGRAARNMLSMPAPHHWSGVVDHFVYLPRIFGLVDARIESPPGAGWCHAPLATQTSCRLPSRSAGVRDVAQGLKRGKLPPKPVRDVSRRLMAIEEFWSRVTPAARACQGARLPSREGVATGGSLAAWAHPFQPHLSVGATPSTRASSFDPSTPLALPSAPPPTPPSSGARSIPYPPARSLGPFLLLATFCAQPLARPSFGFSQSIHPPPSFGPFQGMPPPFPLPSLHRPLPGHASPAPSPPAPPRLALYGFCARPPPPSWAIPSVPRWRGGQHILETPEASRRVFDTALPS